MDGFCNHYSFVDSWKKKKWKEGEKTKDCDEWWKRKDTGCREIHQELEPPLIRKMFYFQDVLRISARCFIFQKDVLSSMLLRSQRVWSRCSDSNSEVPRVGSKSSVTKPTCGPIEEARFWVLWSVWYGCTFFDLQLSPHRWFSAWPVRHTVVLWYDCDGHKTVSLTNASHDRHVWNTTHVFLDLPDNHVYIPSHEAGNRSPNRGEQLVSHRKRIFLKTNEFVSLTMKS